MKMRSATILAVVLLCGVALAQDRNQEGRPRREGQAPDGPGPGRRGPGGPGGPGIFLPPILNLTDDQKTQVEAIRKDEAAKIEALRKRDLPREEYRTEMMAIQKQTREQVEAILTAEQKAKLAEIDQRRGPGGRGGPGPDRRPPPKQDK